MHEFYSALLNNIFFHYFTNFTEKYPVKFVIKRFYLVKKVFDIYCSNMYFQLNTIQNTVNSKAQSLPLKKKQILLDWKDP